MSLSVFYSALVLLGASAIAVMIFAAPQLDAMPDAVAGAIGILTGVVVVLVAFCAALRK